MEYCNLNIIPLNKTTMKFYGKIDNKNKETWNNLEPILKNQLKKTL